MIEELFQHLGHCELAAGRARCSDRLPGGRGPGRPGSAHRAGRPGAAAGRRRRLRPALGGGAARPGPGRRRAHQRRQGAGAGHDGPGRDQRAAGRPGRRGTRRSCGSRAATRSCSPGAARRRRRCRRPACRSRSCPASPPPSPCPPTPASRSRCATRRRRSRSSPATRTRRPVTRAPSTGRPWRGSGGTIVILMGVARIGRIAAELVAGGLPPDTPAAAVRWGTRPEQTTVRATLATIADQPARHAVGDRGRRGGRPSTWPGSSAARCSAGASW